MFDLPKSTEIRKPIHKKLIYQKFATELSGDKKDKFDADISRIIITNEVPGVLLKNSNVYVKINVFLHPLANAAVI